MKKFFNSAIGLFRLIAFLEGLSLLVLVFIGVPMKHFMDDPSLVISVGPIHGILFLLFVVQAFIVAKQYQWLFFKTTWKVILASFIPFGTFYIDHHLLSPLHQDLNSVK